MVLVFPDADLTYFGLKGGRSFRRMFRTPPLGILYISAALEAAGFPTVIVNEEAGQRLTDRLIWLRELKPLFIGYHTNIMNEPIVVKTLERLRAETDAPIVTGGPGCFRPKPFLDAGADAMVMGEGEATIVDIARHYEGGGGGWRELAGIAYLEDGQVVSSERAPIADLDSIPFPSWLKNPEITYYNRYSYTAREPYFTAVTGRGCAMRCEYCSSPTLWQHTVRRRSVENVIEEIRLLYKHFGVRYIDFYDDIFFYKGDWETRFCEAVLRLPFRFNWGAIFYPKKVPLEALTLMRRAGCDTVKIGMQTVNSEVLRGIGRSPSSVEHGRELIRHAKSLGMMTSIDFIFGLPGSTRATLQATVDFMFKADPTLVKIGELEFYAGSPLYERRHESATDVPRSEMESLHRRTLRRFYLRPCKLWEMFRLMCRNPLTFKHAFVYVEFLLRHVLFGSGRNQCEITVNKC